MQSGADKSRVLDDLLLTKAIEEGAKGLTVYIGDSASDVSPLLAADVGIIVGQNKLLRQVAAAAGITIKPLAAGRTIVLLQIPFCLQSMYCRKFGLEQLNSPSAYKKSFCAMAVCKTFFGTGHAQHLLGSRGGCKPSKQS